MKKILIMLATLTVASAANAADTTWSWDGEARVRYQNNADANLVDAASGDSQGWAQRNMLGISMMKGADTKGHVTLMHNHAWGGQGATGVLNNSATVNDLLNVNEAYVWHKMNDSWSLTFGRKGWEMGNGSVIARNDFEAAPLSFEGAALSWDHDMVAMNFFWAMLNDPVTGVGVSTSDPENKLFGLSGSLKAMPEMMKDVNFHVFQRSADVTSTTAGLNEIRYGLTLAGGMAGVNYDLTYNGHTGNTVTAGSTTEVDKKGSMIDVKAGYKMDNMGFHVGFHTDSGTAASATTPERYDAFAYDMHNNAGKMDIVAWGNLTSINAGASMMMWNTQFNLDFWTFKQTEKDDAAGSSLLTGGGANTSGNGGLFPTTVNATEDALGTEIDLEAVRTYDNGLMVTTRFGIFTPGDVFASTAESFSMFFVEAKMPF